MRGAGVAPKSARKEPCDSIFQEFEFLSFLYGSLASAIQGLDAGAQDSWQNRIDQFLNTHVLNWMPGFMKRTILHSGDSVYGMLARSAQAFLDRLAYDTQSR